jgi:hypothetical protein
LGGVKRIGLAALDASSGRLLSWKAPGLFQPPSSPGWPPGSVSSLAYSGSRLYFAGTFGELGPKRVLRRAGVAAVRASDGALTTFSPRAQLSAAGALAVAGRLVLIGGGEGDGVFDSRTGRVVRGFAFDQIGSASAIAVNRSTAYLGGWFGGKNSLIAIDLRTARYRNWFPKIRDYYVTVSGIAVSGGRVLAGGSFCPGP